MGKRFLIPAKGLLSVVPDVVNLLLKRAALMRVEPNWLIPNRPSG